MLILRQWLRVSLILRPTRYIKIQTGLYPPNGRLKVINPGGNLPGDDLSRTSIPDMEMAKRV